MTARELITKWGFEIEHEKLDGMEKQLEGIKNRLSLLGAIEVLKGVVELTEKFSKFAEELHVAATSAGVTVEAFQKLAFAAKQSTVDQGELGGAMARLSRHLYEARKGGVEAQQAFAQAGFTSTQIQGFKTGSDVMLALADRFKGIQDPIQKQALAMQLMGRGSVNMVGFLSQGSGAIKGLGNEAERLGIVLGEHQVDALVKVEHAFLKIYSVVKSMTAFFVAELAPSITYIINGILKWTEANNALIKTDVRQWAYQVLYYLGYIFGSVYKVIKAFSDWAAQHKSMIKFLEFFGALVAGLSLANIGFNKVTGGIGGMGKAFSFVLKLLTTGFSGWLFAIGLIVVAVHDLWNAIHGKPTWIQAFIDWLGIGHEVQSVFFAIFQLITDLFNLDFKSALGDILEDAKDIAGFFNKFTGGSLGGIVQKVTNVASSISPSIAPSGIGGGGNTVSVSAPITVNASGASPSQVAKAAQNGVREHMDRVHRETQRSLRGAQAY